MTRTSRTNPPDSKPTFAESPAMFFKNLTVYRLPRQYKLTAEQLTGYLSKMQFAPCGNLEMQSTGWASPTNDDRLVYASHGQFLLKLVTEKKLLPTAVINEAAAIRACELEEQQGFKPGRKQMKEIKETVTDELLPRAFAVKKATMVWIDTINGWLVSDAATVAAAEEAVTLLRKAVETFPIQSWKVKQSSTLAMTTWLQSDEAPDSFTVDAETELKATGETKASVKYVNAMETKQVQEHIAAGKRCTRLAMTWNDRVSFVLTDNLTLKKVAPLDVLKESPEEVMDDEGRLEAAFAVMTGELARLLDAMTVALGGEENEQQDWVQESHSAPEALPANDDELYPQAREVVLQADRASISLVQRQLRIGYNHAARLIELMEQRGDLPKKRSTPEQMELASA
ncbi:recombination-associated protein RdgC [Noviherbaspirillum galbum]|uniref:Recombination-associated protein RdgC n=1 Tax=Noviherbaspirillum galbum TaxID=2709383 RepID=A0A6B3SHK6_9BURK|nr:recombination-associated protein RdgC [Noviherbaspirillum galbum]NEX60140.1 recombination-associated protein RdgC [Noviherbaspirillum galbum]